MFGGKKEPFTVQFLCYKSLYSFHLAVENNAVTLDTKRRQVFVCLRLKQKSTCVLASNQVCGLGSKVPPGDVTRGESHEIFVPEGVVQRGWTEIREASGEE